MEVKDTEALISQLVVAFFENVPYYPLPLAELDIGKELWNVFVKRYVGKAEEIFEQKDSGLAYLPAKFIDSCVEREREGLARVWGMDIAITKGSY